MKKFAIAVALVFVSVFAHAEPEEGVSGQDALSAFLSEQPIVSQLSSARQNLTDRAARLVDMSMTFLGTPYRFGGNSIEEGGVDCSGFVRAVYQKTLGKILPRRAADQAAATKPIDRSELKPGDLVFFNTMRRAFSHVGIYIGNNQFIHAPRTGSVVRIENMGLSYWQQRFEGARRVDTTQTDGANTFE